jgi:hypothetical protein
VDIMTAALIVIALSAGLALAPAFGRHAAEPAPEHDDDIPAEPVEHHGADLDNDTEQWLTRCHDVIGAQPTAPVPAEPDWLTDWNRRFRNTTLAMTARNASIFDEFDRIVSDLHTAPDWLQEMRATSAAAEVRAVVAEAQASTDPLRTAFNAAELGEPTGELPIVKPRRQRTRTRRQLMTAGV